MNYNLLKPEEPFTNGNNPLNWSIGDFWSYMYSNLWDDMQSDIAEFIVAKALGIEKPTNKNGWRLWDIDYRGARIEVKQTSYFYSWQRVNENGEHNISKQRSFGIAPAYLDYKVNTSDKVRQNDIYVFCLNKGKNQIDSNPLELTHWVFYVVPTSKINKLDENREEKQKKISLGRVIELGVRCTFEELKGVVDSIIKNFDI